MVREEKAREYWRPWWDDLWRRATLYAGGGREASVTAEELLKSGRSVGDLHQEASWHGARVRRYSLAEARWLVWWEAGAGEPRKEETNDR